MTFSKMNVGNFIKDIVKMDNIHSILEKCKTQSEKGFIFERLWDIVIKFWACDQFPKSDFIHMTGNVNLANLKELKTYTDYLKEPVCSGNSSGSSDISLYNKISKTHIFITSKFPKTQIDITKQKSVSYYDIDTIVSVVNDNIFVYDNYEIYMLVPDKTLVLEKVKNANKSSKHITKYMTENHILDMSNLNNCFLKFKAGYLLYTETELIMDSLQNLELNYDKLYLSPKSQLIPRFHQEFISEDTSINIDNGEKNHLWGVKCRGGKTIMTGSLIIKRFNKLRKLNVLIITPAPTETAPQFTDDLFNSFSDFEPFQIHNIEDSKFIPNIEIGENNIFVMSKQLLQNYIDDKTLVIIKNLQIDIIFFDENHFSGTTELSKSIVRSYSSKNTSHVFLTATYKKSLLEWNIKLECQKYWDIEDEVICKSILLNYANIEKLKEKHGESIITKTIQYLVNTKGISINEIFAPYKNMPELYLITTMYDNEKYDAIKSNIMGSKYGFCFDILFALNPTKTRFQYESEVKQILRFISGSKKEVDYKMGDKSMLSRINRICSEKESRNPFTQIWFLPSDNINEISICLEKLMKEDSILSKYDILCINRKNKELAKSVKDDISKQEIIARKSGKEGVILLAGNMLTLGITLNLCDIVLLMNNTLSSDKVLQQMYRGMTEGTDLLNPKKYGFVIDLNISRVLNTCINYTVYKNNNSIEEKIKYLIENNLINIDVDIMEQKRINSDAIVIKLMEIWKSDPINSFRTLLQNLENDYIEFDTTTQSLINQSFKSSIKDDNIVTTIVIKDDDDQPQVLPSGKTIIKLPTLTEKEDKPEIEITVSFAKEVLVNIIPLANILTLKSSNKDFIRMLNEIHENAELLDIFDDMCLIWWNKKDLINIIKQIILRYFNNNSNTYNISIQFKMSLQSLIDTPDKLLQLINDCLKPKIIEKKKFGEVFTPLQFINNNMLDNLATHYTEKYGKNIYEDETKTWCDTTTGMGNFPVAIYYKLMDGLKYKIINQQERKKHIIENMLYMAESNKKNCFIIKQVFNINNEFKLNLYEGDSLKMDIQKEFGISKFDIIIGNPPYNEEFKGKNGYAPALYHKFVEYSIDICQMLCFVIPSRWFSGGRGLNDFRKNMLSRKDIVYINHYDDACKIFGKSVDIKGGVNYFLIDNKYNGQCKYNGIMINLNDCDILIDSKYLTLIDKLSKFPKLNSIYKSKGNYGIPLTDIRLHDIQMVEDIKCYVSQQKGFNKYIEKKSIPDNKFGKWKVITPSAAYGGFSGFANLIIGNPDEVHSETYISFDINTENEAKSLLSYMKCRLPNMMLSIRKNTQNISNTTCKWIPLPPLDKEWTDSDVYQYYKLSEDDIKLISETNIDSYTNLIPIHTKPTEVLPMPIVSTATKIDNVRIIHKYENREGVIINKKFIIKSKLSDVLSSASS